MEKEQTKTMVFSALIWKFLERSGVQGIQFLVQLILARIVTPEEYGLISIVMIFILLSNVFVQSGFNTALIQKKNSDQKDFSSVLYLSLFIAVILYITLYFASPSVASFFDNQQLVPLLRVLSITLFPGAINSVQVAYVSKKMQFKKLFKSSLASVFISGALGIVFAYQGLGVWAIVVQQLSQQFLVTFILAITVDWKPSLQFSLTRIKGMFSFGYKLLLSSLLNELYNELRTIIIGRVYSPAALAFYDKGRQFPNVIIQNINGSIQSVMLPTLASYQDDKFKMKNIMRRSIETSSLIVFPALIGLAAVAEPLIELLLTETWLPAVPFLRIYCFSSLLLPIHTTNLQAINAVGRSDIYLKLEIAKKTVGVVLLLISVPMGIEAIAWSAVVSSIVSSFINAYPNTSLLGYSYFEQVKDIIPTLVLSMFMGVLVYSMNFLPINPLILLIFQVLIGFLIYVGITKLFKIKSMEYLIQTLQGILLKYKRISN